MGPLETPLYAGIPLESLVQASDSEVGKIQGIGKSAGKCSDEGTGSSETTCGEPSGGLGFDCLLSYKLAGTQLPLSFSRVV